MPRRRVHLKFDEYLREHGVIREDTKTDAVHNRMDKDLPVYGYWNHHYADYYNYPNGIRNWIRKGSHLGHQDTLTDYVRVALGHMVLDNYWAKYRRELESGDKTSDEVIELAFRNFISRGYDSARSRS